jgi:fatty acid desaturase
MTVAMEAGGAVPRDYRLQEASDINGPRPVPAVDWYTTPLPRQTLKALVARSDRLAGAHFALWLALLAGSGTVAYLAWGTWWAVPAFLVYGVIYSSSDSRWHELSHGTPFRTRWLNEAFYHFCSFLTLREGVRWRWSHARHHTHTIIVGRDPEIHATRPPAIAALVSGLLNLKGGPAEVRKLFAIAAGRIPRDVRLYVPRSEWGTMVLSSRIYVLLLGTTAAACVAMGSVLPALFVVLPRWYGGFLHFTQAITQHVGLAEDVPDHRLNARTVLMNPAFRFLYSNMNYHVEHHMFPMVLFYRLPELHALIRHDLPEPYDGLLAAYREIVPTLLRQTKDPTHFVRRVLPPGAGPARVSAPVHA